MSGIRKRNSGELLFTLHIHPLGLCKECLKVESLEECIPGDFFLAVLVNDELPGNILKLRFQCQGGNLELGFIIRVLHDCRILVGDNLTRLVYSHHGNTYHEGLLHALLFNLHIEVEVNVADRGIRVANHFTSGFLKGNVPYGSVTESGVTISQFLVYGGNGNLLPLIEQEAVLLLN